MAGKKPTREEAKRQHEAAMRNAVESDPLLPLPGKKSSAQSKTAKGKTTKRK